MNLRIFTFLFLLVKSALADITVQDLNQIKCAVYQQIDTFQGLGPQPLLAKLVRLSFHDCIGGCDGVINMTDHGNAGLDVPIYQIEQIYNKSFSKKMSRADFWAAAGTFAILKGVINAGPAPNKNLQFPRLKFYSGRIDGSGVHIVPPSPHGGIDQVVNFFSQTFGFGVVDSVAIMGAHSLGGAVPQNSGFDGPWIDNSNWFTNQYYQAILRSQGWQRVPDSVGQQQWEQINSSSITMMLDVDMTLYKNFGTPNPNTGDGVTCTSSPSCPSQARVVTGVAAAATTAELVALYAEDLSIWFRHFATAFNQMITTRAPKTKKLTEIDYTYDLPCCCSTPCQPRGDGDDDDDGGDHDHHRPPTTTPPTSTPPPVCPPKYDLTVGGFAQSPRFGGDDRRNLGAAAVTAVTNIPRASAAAAVVVTSAVGILARLRQLSRRRTTVTMADAMPASTEGNVGSEALLDMKA